KSEHYGAKGGRILEHAPITLWTSTNVKGVRILKDRTSARIAVQLTTDLGFWTARRMSLRLLFHVIGFLFNYRGRLLEKRILVFKSQARQSDNPCSSLASQVRGGKSGTNE